MKRAAKLKKPHRFTSEPSEVSARMRLIRSKNTKPEVQLFSILSDAHIKFTAHVRLGNVSADAFLHRGVAIFVDSPFWHLRDKRELKRLSLYWRNRLIKNWTRDRRQERLLRRRGYCVIRFWADRLDVGRVLSRVRAAQDRAKERGANHQPKLKYHRRKTQSLQSQTRTTDRL